MSETTRETVDAARAVDDVAGWECVKDNSALVRYRFVDGPEHHIVCRRLTRRDARGRRASWWHAGLFGVDDDGEDVPVCELPPRRDKAAAVLSVSDLLARFDAYRAGDWP